ncbi:uncharacterized protein LOC133187928 [Saccostrea echinata]|uniref:uncharacterized protein LOC133187928 n=1 Tax=Saccostrea echinata TaxID=191078 RepID=UPI002A830FEE|nr:uncharacterized protein LOC133187928 [Saccostrea echinata]
MYNLIMHELQLWIYLFVLILVRDGRCSQSDTNISNPCRGEIHLNLDLPMKVAKMKEFSSKLRGISDTLYKEHLSLTDSLVKLVGLPASKVAEACRQDPSLVFPHPSECQLYYNCSMMYTKVPVSLEQHLMECQYPDVFSTRSLKCENFTRVCCGTRNVTKDKCDYRSYVGSISTCKWEYPSCKGKTDGFHQGYQGPNSYINCFQERLINRGTCKDDDIWDIYKIPYNGNCTNPFEVPHKDGGFLSSCEGKTDGNYRFEYDSFYMGQGDYFGVGRQCDAFYRCEGGVATAVKCPNGTVFEPQSRSCKAGNHSIELGCQLYCNPNFKMWNGFPNNLAECPYPEQFSDVTHTCENFTKVTCGSRPEVKDYCKYRVQLFMNRHMGNCEGYHFSCAGLPDGFNEHPVKRPGPYYVLCFQERLVFDGACPRDNLWQAQTFPYKGQCTQRYAIPVSHHGIGLLPDCSGKSDGNYQYPSGKCDAYYRCEQGNATAVKCPPNTNFDVRSEVCRTGVTCSG